MFLKIKVLRNASHIICICFFTCKMQFCELILHLEISGWAGICDAVQVGLRVEFYLRAVKVLLAGGKSFA